MHLIRLKAGSFRNLTSLNLDLSPNLNLIHGLNGSGKTSLLEAIYILGLGRSFRTNLTNRIVNYEADSFSVFAQLIDEQNIVLPIGIEKNRQGKIRLKLGSESSVSQAELARCVPIQLLNPDSYALLTDGPKPRREFIDWGVFHVEHSFFNCWQRFQRALKQRNSGLQQKVSAGQIRAWDQEIVTAGNELALLRKEYLNKLMPIFFKILSKLINLEGVTLNYYVGWDEDSSLLEVLEKNFPRDFSLGYTQFGPQRADLVLKMNNLPVQDVLSRGEQKLLVIALRLAQGALLKEIVRKNCVYLLDDIAAELDHEKRQLVLSFLKTLDAQIFATAVDKQDFIHLEQQADVKMFHVEHGVFNSTAHPL